jgi:hypothetical protein
MQRWRLLIAPLADELPPRLSDDNRVLQISSHPQGLENRFRKQFAEE